MSPLCDHVNPAEMLTTGLFFSCVPHSDVPTISEKGLTKGAVVYPRFEAALRACSKCIIAISALDIDIENGDSELTKLPHPVSSEMIVNLNPGRPLLAVEAAGGIIVRPGRDVREILLIYRRGVWDLPKGKRDAGESLKACARREVCEELGIESVKVGQPLGQTVHGYVHRGNYAVKTTHWFLMSTAADSFTPQKAEGIEKVAWMPWNAALDEIGFEILRRHLLAVDQALEAT